jgi:hypothetical protein
MVIKQIDASLLAWQPVGINMAIDPFLDQQRHPNYCFFDTIIVKLLLSCGGEC